MMRVIILTLCHNRPITVSVTLHKMRVIPIVMRVTQLK